MQTLFDLVQADYIIHSLIFNIASLGSVAISNIVSNLDETFARVLSLTLFSLVLSNTIHFSGACLTQLASIYLLGIIEEVNGEKIKYKMRLILYLSQIYGLIERIPYNVFLKEAKLLPSLCCTYTKANPTST